MVRDRKTNIDEGLKDSPYGEHIPADRLEQYALGRAGSDDAGIEEHLLLCSGCQDRLENLDEFILAYRAAARQVPAVKAPFWRRWRSPAPAWAAGALAAAALVMAVIVPPSAVLSPVTVVSLESSRGDVVSGVGSVAQGSRPEFQLDRRGLPERPAYRVQVVTSSGQVIDDIAAHVEAERLRAVSTRALDPGLYWIRVVDSDGALLREFGLRSK